MEFGATLSRYLIQARRLVTISVLCKCGGRFKAKEEFRGTSTKCPQCGASLIISDAPPNPSAKGRTTPASQLTGTTPAPVAPQSADSDPFSQLDDLSTSQDPLTAGDPLGESPPLGSPGMPPAYGQPALGAYAPLQATRQTSKLRPALILGGSGAALLLLAACAGLVVWGYSLVSRPTDHDVLPTPDEVVARMSGHADFAPQPSHSVAPAEEPGPSSAEVMHQLWAPEESIMPTFEFGELVHRAAEVEGDSYEAQRKNPANRRQMELTVVFADSDRTGAMEVIAKGPLVRTEHTCHRMRQTIFFLRDNKTDASLQYGDRITVETVVKGTSLDSQNEFRLWHDESKLLSHTPANLAGSPELEATRAACLALTNFRFIEKRSSAPNGFTGDIHMTVRDTSRFLENGTWRSQDIERLANLKAIDAFFLELTLGKLKLEVVDDMPAKTPVTDVKIRISRGNSAPDIFRSIARWKTLRAVVFHRDYWFAQPGKNELAPLATLPELVTLKIAQQGYTDEHLAQIGNIKTLRFLDVSGNRISGAGVEKLTTLKDLEYLDLSRTSISDQDLKALAPLSKLKGLNLSQTNVTGTGFAHLSGLENLVFVNLDGARVTEEALTKLASVPGLEILYLEKAKLTDEALAGLTSCSSLRTLDLAGTHITDAGLKHLEQIPTLRSVNLGQGKITEAGKKRLKEAVPGLKTRLQIFTIKQPHWYSCNF
jgi:Leucine-rich repeat (LRR) protein